MSKIINFSDIKASDSMVQGVPVQENNKSLMDPDCIGDEIWNKYVENGDPSIKANMAAFEEATGLSARDFLNWITTENGITYILTGYLDYLSES